MDIRELHFRAWGNSVKTVRETAKAVQLEVVGDSRFVVTGYRAWFPKSALEVDDGYATIKPWFIPKMRREQDLIVGFAE